MKYHRFKPKYMEKENFDTCIFYFNKDEYISVTPLCGCVNEKINKYYGIYSIVVKLHHHKIYGAYLQFNKFRHCRIFRLIQDKTVQEKNFKKKVRETIKTYESQIKEMICQLEGL